VNPTEWLNRVLEELPNCQLKFGLPVRWLSVFAVGFLAAVKFICHSSTGELTYCPIKLARLDIVVVTGRALPAITQRRE
jgi:hypothetical protein